MLAGNYVIAGATGLMGTTALVKLRDQPNIMIKAVYNRKEPFLFADNITYIKADLATAEGCRRVVKGSDYVFSFAGQLMTAPVLATNPVSPLTKNLLITAQLMEASYSAGVKKFLYISSSTGYPAQNELLHEEEMFRDDPADAYFSVGWMFRYTETLCQMYATKLKNPMPVTVIRPSTIYGEFEDFDPAASHMLPGLIRKVVNRDNPLEVWGSGDVRRDLIHADDLFDACLLALERQAAYEVFNIAYGREYKINEILEIIMRADGYKDASIIYNDTRPITGGRRVLDVASARKYLGFIPKTDLETGIKKMIDQYKKSHCKGNPPWPQ